MKDVWDRIHRWLGANAPEVLESLQPGASDAAIGQVEAALGVTLPEDVKAAYRIHDGQAGSMPPGFLYCWEWLSLERMLSTWKCGKDLLDNGTFSAEVKSHPTGPIRDDWWHPKWVPVTCDGGASHHCLDLAPKRGGVVGQVILWWNDQGASRVG